MELGLTVVGGEPGAASGVLRALAQRLRVEEEFRGRVALEQAAPGPGEMGGAVELVSVALASGGAGTVLLRVVADWLRRQRSHVVIRVSRSEHETFELDVENVKDPAALLDRFAAFVNGTPGDDGAP